MAYRVHSFVFRFYHHARVFVILEFGGVDWISCCVITGGREPTVGDRNRVGAVSFRRSTEVQKASRSPF